MRFLIDEMYGETVARLLSDDGHDAVHVRSIGLGGTPDSQILARAVDENRTLVTDNAIDFLPLLDQRQGSGLGMTPVLIALTSGRGTSGGLHHRLASDISAWADEHPQPYAHAHWLP